MWFAWKNKLCIRRWLCQFGVVEGLKLSLFDKDISIDFLYWLGQFGVVEGLKLSLFDRTSSPTPLIFSTKIGLGAGGGSPVAFLAIGV